MGLPSRKYVDARHRDGTDCRHDRRKTPPRLRKGRGRRAATRLTAALAAAWLTVWPAEADKLRIATYNVELERNGPGLLLRDILRDEDAQILAIEQVIARIDPDILVLQKVDYDYDLLALKALRDKIARSGPDYPHMFALRPNTGIQTGLDMNGDGRAGRAHDAQSHGEFSGQGGMAILSRYPIEMHAVEDFSALLWRDFPNALIPVVDGAVFPSTAAIEVQRLSSVGHWVVPIKADDTVISLMTFHATTPVFDGPEDRNGRRNHDEVLFWQHYMDGVFGPAPESNFILIGDANLDPLESDGRKEAIQRLLDDPRLQDPRPRRTALQAAGSGQNGDAHLKTVFWPDPGPGELRVDYVLPSADLRIVGSGVYWPTDGTAEAHIAETASRHRLVWVDIDIDG